MRWFFKDRDALFAYGKYASPTGCAAIQPSSSRQDSTKQLTIHREFFNNNPCTLTIAGTKLYLITQPDHFAEVYRNTTSLSFDKFVRGLHESFLMSPAGIEKMWEVPMAHEKHLAPVVGGRNKHLLQRSTDFHRLQLLPGPRLQALNERFLASIARGTKWSNLPQSCILSSTSDDEMVVSLYKWCGEVLVDAASRAFYGDVLVETEPQLIRDFLAFDEFSWMSLYQYPAYFAGAMTAPRDRVMQAFDRYVALPSERKLDSAYYTKALEEEQVKAGMLSRDRAIGFQIFHWA